MQEFIAMFCEKSPIVYENSAILYQRALDIPKNNPLHDAFIVLHISTFSCVLREEPCFV